MLIKAWCIDLNSGGRLYDSEPHSLVSNVWDDNENEVFTVAEVESMNVGDKIERGEWTVECVEVDDKWLAELPEHDGW